MPPEGDARFDIRANDLSCVGLSSRLVAYFLLVFRRKRQHCMLSIEPARVEQVLAGNALVVHKSTGCLVIFLSFSPFGSETAPQAEARAHAPTTQHARACDQTWLSAVCLLRTVHDEQLLSGIRYHTAIYVERVSGGSSYACRY